MDNPLLQALIQGVNDGQLRVANKQRQAMQEQDLKERQLEHDRNYEHQKILEDLEYKKHDAAVKSLAAQLSQAALQKKLTMAKAYQEGTLKPNSWSDEAKQSYIPDTLAPQVPQPDQFKEGDDTYSVNEFGNFEDVVKRKGQATLGEKKPLLDYNNTLQENLINTRGKQAVDLAKERTAGQTALEDKKHTNALELQGVKDTAAEKREKLRAEAKLKGDGIRAAATRYAASIRSTRKENVDDAKLKDDAELASTGFLDVTSANSNNNKHVRNVVTASGRVPFSPKKAEALKNISQFTGVLSDMDKFIEDHGENGAIGTMVNMAKANVPLVPTDIKADTEQLKGRAAKVATFMGEIGRKTEGDINRALQVMTSSSQTKDKMQQARTRLVRDFADGVRTLLAGVPKEQQQHILDVYQVPDDIQDIVMKREDKPNGGQTPSGIKLTNGDVVNESGDVIGRWKP